MIRIFRGDETNFSHDGVEVLDDITISSYTQWQENGKWNIEAKFKKDFDKSESIKDNMILKVPTEKGEQLFRIKYTNKQNKKYISVIGDHIGFDFNDNFIQDINIVEKSGNAAINQISGGTVYTHKYTLTSNIEKVASARMVRKNGIDALISEADNSFINRWGGYLVLDNFNIAMNESTGIDRGVEIAIGKNTKGFTGVIDSNNICTGINAISFDGIKLPEGVYYSSLVDNYDHPKIQEFKFEDIKYKYSENNFEQDGYETLEEVYSAMREACNELFSVYNIDKPKCTLRVDIVALENTDQYKGDELNERIFQGDILTANLEEYGFPVKLKMVMNRYDNILDRYIDIDLGETRNNLVIGINNIKNNVDKVLDQLGGKSWEDILNESMDKAAQLIAVGIKDSYVVCRKNEILVMDNPVVESAINVIRINKNGIAFSRTGYNGPFTIAITIDGKINASCILTGELDAALIKTGLLSSANGTTWINMEDGTFNLADKITYDGNNFKIKNKNSSVIINDNGQTITNGAFELTNSNGTVVIDGKSNMFKIHATVDLSLNAGSNLDYVYNYTHGLGYVPAFLGFQVDTPSSISGNVQLPAFSVGGLDGVSLAFSSIIRATADDTKIKINYKRANTDIRSDFKTRIFIYKEALI